MNLFKEKRLKMLAQEILATVKEAIFTGISYIVPLIVAGSLIVSIAIIAFGQEAVMINGTVGNTLKLFGNNIFAMMIPIFSGYVAYGIAEKDALIPGVAAGIAANTINSGFLGGIAGGIIAGYAVYNLKKIKLSSSFQGIMGMFICPLFGSLIAGCIMFFVIGAPIAFINTSMVNYLGTLEGANKIILGIVVGCMVCFDMGGPVNKAAFAFSLAAIQAGNGFPYAAFAAAKCMPGIAVSISAVLFSKYFSKSEVDAAKSTWILGLIGVTEGALPFALSDPLRVIPAMMLGGAVAGSISIGGGSSLLTAGGSILTIPVTEKPLNWILALAAGTLTAAVVLTVLKMIKGQNVNNQENEEVKAAS